MPPKSVSTLSQKLTEARGVFSDEVAVAIVEQWASLCAVTLSQSEAGAKEVASNVFARAAAPEETPQDVVEVLRVLHSTYSNLYSELQIVRSAVGIRIPEIKEEDNLGVNVQLLVLKEIEELEKRLLGGGADASSAPTINFPREYYAARTAIEEKLLGTGKPDEKPSMSPSLRRQLQQLDYDTMVKAALAFAGLAARLRSIVSAFTLNSKKLMNPRSSNDRMIS
jgi:hypothetical protein